MPTARVGITTYKTGQAASKKSSHVHREHGSVNGVEPNIIPIILPTKNAFSLSKKVDAKDRRQLQKKIQKLKERAKKYRDEGKEKLAEKQEAAAAEIRSILDATLVKGKNRVEFIELEIVITETTPNQEIGKWLAKIAPEFIQKYFGDDVELISGAVHLDQASTHAHIFVKPTGKSWTRIVEERVKADEDPYRAITQAWHDMAMSYEKIELTEPKRGTAKEYTNLKSYKEAMRRLVAREAELNNREMEIKIKEQELEITIKEERSLGQRLMSLLGTLESLSTAISKADEFILEMKSKLSRKSEQIQAIKEEMSDEEFKKAYSDKFTQEEDELIFPRIDR